MLTALIRPFTPCEIFFHGVGIKKIVFEGRIFPEFVTAPVTDPSVDGRSAVTERSGILSLSKGRSAVTERSRSVA